MAQVKLCPSAHENQVDDNVCRTCGADIKVVGCACEVEHAPTDKHCGKCGKDLTIKVEEKKDAPEPPAPDAPPAA